MRLGWGIAFYFKRNVSRVHIVRPLDAYLPWRPVTPRPPDDVSQVPMGIDVRKSAVSIVSEACVAGGTWWSMKISLNYTIHQLTQPSLNDVITGYINYGNCLVLTPSIM